MLGWYWSGKHNLWTSGYFVSTVGEISKDKVIEATIHTTTPVQTNRVPMYTISF